MGKRRSRADRASTPLIQRHQIQASTWAALIVGGGVLAYANGLNGPFIFDDQRTILDNLTIRHLWPLATVLHPQRQSPVAARPLANLSFAINYAVSGFDVTGYHVFNIAVHILAALVLFGVLRHAMARMAPIDFGGRTADRLALFCTLVWMLHPLNTEAVDYVTQRTESLAGLFYLLTIYGAMRSWRTAHPWRWQAFAIVANVCGMATKESMVIAPAMVVLGDRVFEYSSFRSAWKRRQSFYAGLAAGWVVFGALASQSPFFSATGFETQVSRWTYLANQAPLVLHYLRLSVWPLGLVVDYGVPQSLGLAQVWPSAALVLALMALTCVALIRAPRVGYWGAWFFVTLAPASSLVPIPTEVGAERRMYLPLVAIVVLIVFSGWRLIQRLAARSGPDARVGLVWRVTGVLLACGVLVFLGVATMQRNAEYRTGVSIWQTVVERLPHARAHSNLAVQLRDAGDLDAAVEHLRIAAPEWPDARHALGSALLERGDLNGAMTQLREFIRERPADREIVSAREELAAALVRSGDMKDAVAEFKMVTSIAPSYARGHRNLANALLSSQDFDGAAAQYRECLRLQPSDASAWSHLGIALAAAGNVRDATDAFEQSLRIDSADFDTRRSLVNALLQQRRFVEAEREARVLVSQRPNDGEGHNWLGEALASEARLDDAIQQFREAVRLNPQARDANENLARALALRNTLARKRR